MGMTLRSVEKAARYQTLFCFFAVALILFALIRGREYIIINTPSMAIIVLQKERERERERGGSFVGIGIYYL